MKGAAEGREGGAAVDVAREREEQLGRVLPWRGAVGERAPCERDSGECECERDAGREEQLGEKGVAGRITETPTSTFIYWRW